MTCLPAPERNLVVQLWAFCLTRSRIDVNMSRFFRPNCSGKPRYFPIPPSIEIDIESFTRARTQAGVFAEKVIADFWGLILCPETDSYVFRIFNKAVTHLGLDLQKNIVSSAKSRWLMGGLLRETLTPGREPSVWPLAHKAESTYVQRMKICGDSGSPCLRPRDGLTEPCGVPLIRKE